MTIRIIDAEDYTGADTLECPKCRGSYLHHGDVVAYERTPYDEPGPGASVVRVVVDSFPITITAKGNPSVRRHGLRIGFECEGCGTLGDLCIAQHKGETFIWWDLG